MIQRIQSIYLLSASLMFFFMINNPIAQIITEDDGMLELNYLFIQADQPDTFYPVIVWPLSMLLFTVIALGIFSIFLFKKRTLQMRLCMFNILLMFGLIAMVYYYAKFAPIGIVRSDVLFLWPIVVPFISAILAYLALKAIQKDDARVKAWERLR